MTESLTQKSGTFVTTKWTQVLTACGDSEESKLALSGLCEAYWMPVFRFIRRHSNEEAARDLTQDFFAGLLAQRGFMGVDQRKGRFRSYLLGAVKHFLSDQWDRARAAKRGSGEPPLPLEHTAGAETTCTIQIPDPGSPPPDIFFDRQWALNVIERALNSVSTEFAEAGKARTFEILKPWLIGEVSSFSQTDAARELGLSAGAVKVTIHRLRKRFRDRMKEEVAATIAEGESVQAEMRYLMEALTE